MTEVFAKNMVASHLPGVAVCVCSHGNDAIHNSLDGA